MIIPVLQATSFVLKEDMVTVPLIKLRVLLAIAANLSTCLFKVRLLYPKVGGCITSSQGLAFDGIVSEYVF